MATVIIDQFPDDDVKTTDAQIRLRNEIIQLNGILARANIPQQVRQQTKRDLAALKQRDANQISQQRRATKTRRDAVPVTSFTNATNITNKRDIYQLSPMFRAYIGQAITLRIKHGENYRLVHIPNYQQARFNQDVLYQFFEDSETLLDNLQNFTITRDTQLPRNKPWQQVFRDNETNTCVLDSLQEALPKPMNKNTQTQFNKLEKFKKQFPNGVTEQDLQIIADKLKFTISLKFILPLASLQSVIMPDCDSKDITRRVTLINSRPHHVQLYTGSNEAKPIHRDEMVDLVSYYHHTPLYLMNVTQQNKIQSLITQDGIFYKENDPFDTSCFFDQFTYHTTTDEFELNQALCWAGGDTYIHEDKPLYEYDMNSAYLQYPYDYAGYLLHEEYGFFEPSHIPKLIELYENDFSTVLFHVTFNTLSRLHQAFNFPKDLIVPSWFLPILDDTDFYISKFEVRKKFKIDMKKVENAYRQWYSGSDQEYKKNWKQTYTKLFGMTAHKQNVETYEIMGCENEDFFSYLQSKSTDEVEFKAYKRDNGTYYLTKTSNAKKYCPQVLHCTTLYCVFELFKLAKTVPISSISYKTLDSLCLTQKVKYPENFKEKPYTKEYEPTYITEFQRIFIEDEIEYTTPSFTPVHQINYHLGAGGTGKTHTNMNKYPNAILVLPTKVLIKDKQKEFPNRKIMTYHKFMGWNSKKIPLHDNKNRRWYGVALIDEITMLTSKQIDEMIKKHPTSQLHFMGDVHTNGIPFQCATQEVSTYRVQNPVYHTTDYRSKTDETRAFKSELRTQLVSIFEKKDYHEYMDISKLTQSVNFQPVNKDKLMLTGSRWTCDYYSEQGMNSLNAHRVQGQTLKEEYQIDITTMTLQKFYTCVSRCEDIKQVSFIAPSNKNDERWNYRETYFSKMGDADEYYSIENELDHPSFHEQIYLD
jgi:hypothetical protein